MDTYYYRRGGDQKPSAGLYVMVLRLITMVGGPILLMVVGYLVFTNRTGVPLEEMPDAAAFFVILFVVAESVFLFCACALLMRYVLRQWCTGDIAITYVGFAFKTGWLIAYAPDCYLTRRDMLVVHLLPPILVFFLIMGLALFLTLPMLIVPLVIAQYAINTAVIKSDVILWTHTHPRGTRYRERTPGVITAE